MYYFHIKLAPKVFLYKVVIREMKNIDFILESDEALKPSERLVLLLLEKHRMLYTNDLLALSNLSYKTLTDSLTALVLKSYVLKETGKGRRQNCYRLV